MLPHPIPEPLLQKQIPELRNPRYYSIYQSGRERCLQQALAGNDIKVVPLYSHNATYQSLFRKGWLSVNAQDIRLAKAEVCHARHA
ncbi:hypothetical protein [Xenorhabdus cabanillasii]|uniref:Uncharacterized protein n=1 Tax=Xenorhabdus cabanillasii JM26 TaxID=1427517 RepID=W1IPI3_9GAMM|nr:hypothetical protein [Xenorhabdus cabanillasii]PHM78431.1 hypothetical protein Xcab_01047 [Xenorhabdus cabanillasii JM26]CDL79743.1 hypothetical protein XCR1_1220028 [Xenorhabdus cabanillasii JM26]